jgi:hypothetical protein
MTTTRTHENTTAGDQVTISYRKYGHIQTVTCTVSKWDSKSLVGTQDNGSTVQVATERIEFAE